MQRDIDELRKQVMAIATASTTQASAFASHTTLCGEQQRQILLRIKYMSFALAGILFIEAFGLQRAMQALTKWMGIS